MNKFKKILLGALSVLTLGLVAVTGAKVEAHSYTADYQWRFTSTSTKLPKNDGVIRFAKENPTATIDLSDKSDTVRTCDSEIFTYGANRKDISTATIYLDASVYESNTVTAFVYVYATSAKNITIGGVAKEKSVNGSIVCRSGDLLSDKNTIVLSDNGQYWMGIDIVLTPTKSNDDFINEAKDAIDAIPNINDGFDEYEIAINVAKNAIKACENGIDDLDDIHKEKYNNALAIYNEAKNSILIEENNSRFGNVSKFTANEVAVDATENTAVSDGTSNLGESIFIGEKYTKQIKDSNDNSTSATIFGTEYNGRLKIEGKNAIKFTTTSSGAISFIALSGSGSDPNRRFVLFEENGTTEIDAVTVPTKITDAKVQVINVPSAGTYYIGATNASGDSKGINIYELSFISNSVKSLSQTYTDSNYTYIRFVTIVKGEAELTSSKFNFGVTMTYTDSSTKTVDYTNNEKLYVVKKITSSGENYVGNVNSQSYEFANHVAEYYVVFILRLTTSTFAGCSVCSNFTYNGLTLHSSSETI